MLHSFFSRSRLSTVCIGFCLATVPACTINNIDHGNDAGQSDIGGADGSTGGSVAESGGSSSTGGGSSTVAGSNTGGGSSLAAGGTSSTAGGASSMGGQGTATPTDSCSDADANNNDRDHASTYVLGTEFAACLQTSSDVDYYEFTTPPSPVDGGVLVIGITSVGTAGNIDSSVYTTSDNGEVQANYSTGSGASVFYWFNATSATKYQVTVHHFTSSSTATPYTLKVAYSSVDDVNEPNDQRAQSKSMTVGTPVHGFLYAGYSVSTGFTASAWEDWYKITLAAGTATIALTDLASDVNGEIDFYDSLGASISSNYSTTSGASVVLNRTGVTAGDYYLKISPFTLPSSRGNGSVVPQYATQPYTLTVTQ